MERPYYLEQIEHYLETYPVVALLGPRQCGKTTLARLSAQHFEKVHYFDLENPLDLARLADAMLTLEPLLGLIVIDEIQRRPDLFPLLRYLVDKPERQQRYLILGSASRDLIAQSSETLAGRIAFIELTPFMLTETRDIETHLLRGGFPLSFLAVNDQSSFEWRNFYVSTFLERDIAMLGFQIPSTTMRRFWMMLAHYHGQLFNASEIGKSLGFSNTSASRYLGILTGTFMIRELMPWWENIGKRQVRSSKIYFRDSGLLLALMGLDSYNALTHHPKVGAIWEGFALEQIISFLNAKEVYFWRTQGGAELDLLVFQKGLRIGFEFKYASAPTLTQSMQHAMSTLHLDELIVIYPGTQSYSLAANIRAQGLADFCGINPE